MKIIIITFFVQIAVFSGLDDHLENILNRLEIYIRYIYKYPMALI